MAQRKTVRKTPTKRPASSAKKTSASRKTKAGAPKTTSAPAKSAGDSEVTIDRRRSSERRETTAGSTEKSPAPPQKLERRQKVNRRRQIDPTTCERDYTGDEIEFMNALDDYKRKSGRMFPTCSEVLEVVRSLGYARISAADLAAGSCRSTAAVVESATSDWLTVPAVDDVEQEEELFETALSD